MLESIIKDKPKNECYYLLETQGDINNPVLLEANKYYTANNITNIECVVYNEQTQQVSTKSAYIGKDNELYIKGRVNRHDKRLYLKDFH